MQFCYMFLGSMGLLVCNVWTVSKTAQNNRKEGNNAKGIVQRIKSDLFHDKVTIAKS